MLVIDNDKTNIHYKFYSVDTETSQISVSTVIRLFYDESNEKKYLLFKNEDDYYIRQYYGELNEKIFFKIYSQKIKEEILSLLRK